MKTSVHTNIRKIEYSKFPISLVPIGKTGLWIFTTVVIFYFLFDNTTGQFIAPFLKDGVVSGIKILYCTLLIICLTILWLVRKTVWKAAEADGDNIKATV
jgi:hypothetical protein